MVRFRHGKNMHIPKSPVAPPVYRPLVVQRQAVIPYRPNPAPIQQTNLPPGGAPPVYRPPVVQRQSAQPYRPSPVPVQKAIVPRSAPPVYRPSVNASAGSPIQSQSGAGGAASANTGHLSSRPAPFVAQPSHAVPPYSRHAASPVQLCSKVPSQSGAPELPTPRPLLPTQVDSQRTLSLARNVNALAGTRPSAIQRYVTYGADHRTRRRPTSTRAYRNLTQAQRRQIKRWQRDGVEHNFTDFNALVAAATPLEGAFLAIPSGTLVPTPSAGRLSHTFDILAQFDSTNGGDHNTGEYRQDIHGTFQVNGAPLVHSLGGGRDLDANMDQEDGFGGTTYGHRGVIGTGSRFGTVVDTGGTYVFTAHPQNIGPAFRGQDTPSIGSAPGNTVAMNLHFRGTLVDTSRPPDSPSFQIDSSQWSVTGTHTI
jgi:hypothetical protein